MDKKKAPATSVKVSHLIEGSEYIVRVKAENKVGQSEALESDKFKPTHMYGRCFKLPLLFSTCFQQFYFQIYFSIEQVTVQKKSIQCVVIFPLLHCQIKQ